MICCSDEEKRCNAAVMIPVLLRATLSRFLTPTYQLAHEDQAALSSNSMRGVRMLLEITKPDLHLEEAGIASTIIVFGGARVVDRSTAEQRIASAKLPLKPTLTRHCCATGSNAARHCSRWLRSMTPPVVRLSGCQGESADAPVIVTGGGPRNHGGGEPR